MLVMRCVIPWCFAALAMLSGLACADPYDGGDPADDDDSMDDDSVADDDSADDDSAVDDDDDDTTATVIEFIPRLAAGYAHTCAVDDEGHVICWGCQNHAEYDEGQCTPPEGQFTQVAAGALLSCALAVDGSVACWGKMDSGTATGLVGPFVQITAGEAHACALDGGGAVTCWGCEPAGSGVCDPPDGHFAQITAADDFACAIGDDLQVVCWGTSGHALDGTDEPLIHVAAGDGVACGIKASNQMVICWDCAWFPDAPLGIAASQVAIGNDFGCLLDEDGLAVCWCDAGDNEYGQADPPSGTFEEIAASRGFHACGRLVNGPITCWGDDSYGQASPP